MKKFIPIVLVLAFIFSFLWITLSAKGEPRLTVASPSGNHVLKVWSISRRVYFEIQNVKGDVIFHCHANSSTLHKWSMRWLSNHKVELNSSDTGKRYWVRSDEGSWVMANPNAAQVSPDGSLKVASWSGEDNSLIFVIIKRPSSVVREIKTAIPDYRLTSFCVEM